MYARLRRAWHIQRRRQGKGLVPPKRLAVTKAKWLWDADSPVVLMIDDLTNAWHSHSGSPTWEHGGDWGGGLDSPRGALAFLEANLLKKFPEARTTFFVVAGPISQYTEHQPFSQALPLDADEASCRFFRDLAHDPRFELAYHGYNHGLPGATTDQFRQEWRAFPSVEAAITQTRMGQEIFLRATGTTPRGGKYGGWDYNEYAEEAVAALGFRYWCRDWTPRDVSGRIADEHYDASFFGKDHVVALPTTVHGHFWDSRQLDLLIARRQIISIEEHIAPIRPDGLIQTPNIVDDIADLRRLYASLRGRNVWHATCSEIASYAATRELVFVHDVTPESFAIRYFGSENRPPMTLRIDCSAICDDSNPSVLITLPDGNELDPGACRTNSLSRHHLVTVPIMNGRYRVTPRPA
jgi:hypothetical protein